MYLFFNRRRNGQFPATSGKQLGYPPNRRSGVQLGRIGEPPSPSIVVKAPHPLMTLGRVEKYVLPTFNSHPRALVLFIHLTTPPLHVNPLPITPFYLRKTFHFSLANVFYTPNTFLLPSFRHKSIMVQIFHMSSNAHPYTFPYGHPTPSLTEKRKNYPNIYAHK